MLASHAISGLPLAAGALAVALATLPWRASAQVNTLPRGLQDVGVTEHLLAQVPLDATFTDQDGRVVRLGAYFDGHRPVLLNLVYYRCPMLCSMVLNGVLKVLKSEPWTVGEQFDVVTISIDPRDTVTVAAEKRQRVLRAYNRPVAARGWHFLVGNATSARRVADALGFRYRFDQTQQQFAHPAVTVLLTPTGRVARYLYGIEYRPNDLRVGLLEASEGRSITTAERVVLFCFHYDPHEGKYVLFARHLMQMSGVVTIAVFGGLLATLAIRDRRRQRTGTALSERSDHHVEKAA